jgi:hypothetical protein
MEDESRQKTARIAHIIEVEQGLWSQGRGLGPYRGLP